MGGAGHHNTSMGLLSLFQRDAALPAGRRGDAGDPAPGSIEQLRTRARRRLIGSAILVVLAVLAFSLLFETQPRSSGRPVAVEVLPRDDGTTVASGTVRGKPGSTARTAETASVDPAPARAPKAPQSDVITESAAEAAQDRPVPVPEPKAQIKADVRSESPAPSAEKPPVKPAGPSESERALALLEGREATPSAKTQDVAKAVEPANGGRFVVQVGAFADEQAARAVRLRVEKLGMKTYTQVVNTGDGRRIRVRVGPFTNRSEADKALNRLKADGLKPAVLTL